MIPSIETGLLRELTIQAIQLALNSEAGDGYTCLLRGMGRVKTLRDAGETWGEELVGRYRRALDQYADRYWVARE